MPEETALRLIVAVAVVVGLLVSTVGIGAATVMVFPPTPEQLIEGHTVFSVIETARVQSESEEFAAAVAVLVRERVRTTSGSRFPGVTWFNDQYLDDPSISARTGTSDRYPCTGAVIAVNRGDYIVDQDLAGFWTLQDATYMNESYLITDPNEHQWIIDLWNTSFGRLAWTTAIMSNPSGGGVADDGKSNCAPWNDSPCTPDRIDEVDPTNPTAISQRCTPTNAPVTNTPIPDPRHKSPGDNGIGYPCQGCAMLKYNAVLYFRLQHLNVAGPAKNHTEGPGDDWAFDPSGCHDSASNAWNCPGGDDDMEGNSHPYNPDFAFGAPYDGRDNHGGSDVCDGIGVDCHATRNIDLYYGYQAAPPVRTFVILDLAGADAPYHCHSSMPLCSPGDETAAVGETRNSPP